MGEGVGERDEPGELAAESFDGKRLIKDGGRVGVKGVLRLVLVAFFFAFPSLILLGISIQRLYATGYDHLKLVAVLLVLALGIGATYFALHRNVQVILIEGVRVIYENLSYLFKKVSDRIVDKTIRVLENQNANDTKIARAIDVAHIVNSEFKKVPNVLRWGIIMVLKRTPLSAMLLEIKSELSVSNKEEASLRLYEKMDNFIRESIFDGNGAGWVWVLLPLSVLMSVLLIVFMIG